MFTTLSNAEMIILVKLNLSSVNAFNLVKALTKLKAFTDDKFNFTKMIISVWISVMHYPCPKF